VIFSDFLQVYDIWVEVGIFIVNHSGALGLTMAFLFDN